MNQIKLQTKDIRAACLEFLFFEHVTSIIELHKFAKFAEKNNITEMLISQEEVASLHPFLKISQ